jgi:hypothetical protein
MYGTAAIGQPARLLSTCPLLSGHLLITFMPPERYGDVNSKT